MLDAFGALGLGRPDGQVYAALVVAPQSTAGELAEQCGLTLQQSQEALDRLAEQGMATRAPVDRERYLAVAPDVAIGTLIGHREAELRSARAEMHRLMDAFREASRYTDPAHSVEVLTGGEAINQRLEHLVETSHYQIRGFDCPPYVMDPTAHQPRQRAKLKSGVRIRTVFDKEAIAWPGRLEQEILVGVEDGEEARVRPVLPMKMMMSDDRMAIIPISVGDSVLDAAYVIHPSALLQALDALFEAEWERAVPLQTALGGDDHGPGPESDHLKLLGLLAAGLTDESIARSLGWSARTTQRRLQGLMRELGATTRFQAGMAARERGWL
ncbi:MULTISPECIES: helix-turn-helix domain-containing protein [Kitasatospora]|uniref:DNA-binding CsgD family transcriptional regulator/DNA-binding transcriptional regulator GbsR (MarR family) n=2 Tax=Kitasatospora TaxID=2063 RepID=A0ABT1ISU5_9ACTN|nr:helix-turn-helix domain-containing protein [Kitasatospora paracochleata]MCP2308213.1 DNA-binding CsgD family transcriptional regulator/DNA-binding transcriptional regulator GbsR (MarR family) [Kitasatospora paracochleata]